MTIEETRKFMADAFEADRDFRRSYVANVAMWLHDRYGIRHWDERNQAATEIVDLVFTNKTHVEIERDAILWLAKERHTL